MSNKDVRKPAKGAVVDFNLKQAGGDPDLARLNGMTPDERSAWAETGEQIKSMLETNFMFEHEPIDDESALGCLDACLHFLNQLLRMTTGVLQTVDVGELRKVVAGDLPLTGSWSLALKALGVDVSTLKPATVNEPRGGVDHRKLPRGRKHPLVVLIGLAVQGVRLVDKITQGTNPGAHNKATKEEKDRKSWGSSIALPDMPGLPRS